MYHLIDDTITFIRRKIGEFNPEFGIILGTGLGKLVEEIDIQHQLMYSNIPNFYSRVSYRQTDFRYFNGAKSCRYAG